MVETAVGLAGWSALLRALTDGLDRVEGAAWYTRSQVGHDDNGRLHGPAVHERDDPVSGALVRDIPDQLPRTRADATGPRYGG
jgi:hypothetical protein